MTDEELHNIFIRKARLRGFRSSAYVPMSVLQELLFETWIACQADRGPEPVLVYCFVVPLAERIQWRYKIVYRGQRFITSATKPISAVPVGIRKIQATIVMVEDFPSRNMSDIFGTAVAAGMMAG